MNDQISTTDGIETVTPPGGAPRRARRRSAAAKLAQAAALAAVLVPLASLPAHADTCSFNGSGSPCEIFGAGAEGFAFFNFADPTYRVALAFDHVVGEFEVTINAFERTAEEMEARFATTQFEGYRPLPIGSNPAAPYIEFQVLAPTPCFQSPTNDCSNANNTWISEGDRGPDAIQGYDLRFYWTAPTDGMFPDPHVLHDTGPSPTDGLYDFDMTDPNFPYTTFVPCVVFNTCEFDESIGDPAIGGRDDMFDLFTMADPTDAVPEPASLVLLGTGLSGWLYRRRRNRKA
jgi:hypothetical protein